MNKLEAIAEIKRLTAQRPDGWVADRKLLFAAIRKMEDPFGDLIHRGNENAGRATKMDHGRARTVKARGR